MIQRGDRAGLVFETLAELGIGNLYGDVPPKSGVACAYDFTHTTSSDRGFDSVPAKLGSNAQL
jgi:hypothetical protein